jgi:thioredoxin-related protein
MSSLDDKTDNTAMHTRNLLRKRLAALLLLAALPLCAQTTGRVTGGLQYEPPEWFKQSFLEIAEDVAEADEAGRHVMLFFHLDGCPYCARTAEYFDREPIRSELQKHFDSIAINIKGDREIAMNEDLNTTERVLASYLKVQYTPTILFLDSDNRTVLRLNGYRSPEVFRVALDYVKDRAYRKQPFSAYKREHLQHGGYRFIDNPLFEDVRDFSGLKEPVMVIFEDRDCVSCETFQRKLISRPEIIEQMRRYRVVRLDADSDEPITDFQGRRTTARAWADQLGISYRPGVVLFDDGKETARVESLLYPFHFEHVLRYGLDGNHRNYASYLDLMAERQQKLLAEGKTINIGKPRDWD